MSNNKISNKFLPNKKSHTKSLIKNIVNIIKSKEQTKNNNNLDANNLNFKLYKQKYYDKILTASENNDQKEKEKEKYTTTTSDPSETTDPTDPTPTPSLTHDLNSNNHNYIIAIPSYNRPELIQTKTLKVLHDHHINSSIITIFVSDRQQYELYKSKIPSSLYNKLIIGVKGLKNQRNYINNYYPEGYHIVQMDDDIDNIVQLDIKYKLKAKSKSKSRSKTNSKSKSKSRSKSKTKSKSKSKTIFKSKSKSKSKSKTIFKSKSKSKSKTKLKHRLLAKIITHKTLKPIDNLDDFIKKAFTKCHADGIFLWGVYPLANAYFMTDTITTDLRFIVGPMFGIINRHREDLQLTIDEKENSERTLQHWVIDGKVLRFNNIGIETKYYKNKGGMQNEGKDRKEEALKSITYLHNKYPKLTKIHLGKKSGVPEIKLLSFTKT